MIDDRYKQSLLSFANFNHHYCERKEDEQSIRDGVLKQN
jgi:hypothetical protein